jgi:hypothetical protein
MPPQLFVFLTPSHSYQEEASRKGAKAQRKEQVFQEENETVCDVLKIAKCFSVCFAP